VGHYPSWRHRLALATAVVSAIGVCGAAAPVMASRVTASPVTAAPVMVLARGSGLTVIGSGAGYKDGYVTGSGARTFGAVLVRRHPGDHGRAGFGGMKITPSASAMDTLVMSATNLQGRPDNGDAVIVHNEDNPALLGPRGGETGVFQHGTATFHVPAGHYWAEGVFADGRATRLVVLPQFTVHGRTAVHLAERSASSRLEFSTPRPAAVRMTSFTLFRGAGNGDLFISGWSGSRTSPLWVSPTTGKPTVGTLDSDTAAQLTSAPGVTGTPYAYNLAYQGPEGRIPAQHFTAGPANLATVRENYHQDVASTGSWCTIGGDVMPDGAFSFSCRYFPFHLPGTQTQYVSTGPTAVWQTSYGELRVVAPGGQSDVLRHFRPGQQVTQDWNAYPLHPQPDIQVLHGLLGLRFPGFPAAFRAGNTLTLSPQAFSDNYPGHFGTGFSGGDGMKVTGSYAVYQNGKQIAGGSPVHGIKPVRLSTKPSTIRFTLTANRQSSMFRFSPETTTTWTWHSAPRPNATVPRSWSCGFTKTGLQRHCAVQPMMTLNYQVAGLALNGTTAAGPQTVSLSVGHIQPAGATRITGASAKVSVNDGHTFRAARVTSQGGGRFLVRFTAPAGAAVTLRVSATDAAGGSISETILRGYGVAP